MLANIFQASVRPALVSGRCTQCHSTEENQSPVSQKLSVANSFLIRSGTSCPLPELSAGIVSGLNLCRYCAHGHRLCEFLCSPAPLCLEDTAVLAFQSFGGRDPSFHLPRLKDKTLCLSLIEGSLRVGLSFIFPNLSLQIKKIRTPLLVMHTGWNWIFNISNGHCAFSRPN